MEAILQAQGYHRITVKSGREAHSLQLSSIHPQAIEQAIEHAKKRLIREALEQDQD